MALLYTLWDIRISSQFLVGMFPWLIWVKVVLIPKVSVLLTLLTNSFVIWPLFGPKWPVWWKLVRGNFSSRYYQQRRFNGPILCKNVPWCWKKWSNWPINNNMIISITFWRNKNDCLYWFLSQNQAKPSVRINWWLGSDIQIQYYLIHSFIHSLNKFTLFGLLWSVNQSMASLMLCCTG